MDSSRAWLEMAAAVATGVGFMIGSQLTTNKLALIVACSLLWLGYVLVRVRRDREVLLHWGVRLDNLRAASRVPLAFLAIAVLSIAAYRLWAGYRPLPASALIVFALYPAWALFQQLFVQSLVAGNLVRLGVPRVGVIAIAAVLFGAVHLPDVPLAALCTIAGVVWTACFLAVPNILPLALGHGWIGALAYYWVLERDPL